MHGKDKMAYVRLFVGQRPIRTETLVNTRHTSFPGQTLSCHSKMQPPNGPGNIQSAKEDVYT